MGSAGRILAKSSVIVLFITIVLSPESDAQNSPLEMAARAVPRIMEMFKLPSLNLNPFRRSTPKKENHGVPSYFTPPHGSYEYPPNLPIGYDNHVVHQYDGPAVVHKLVEPQSFPQYQDQHIQVAELGQKGHSFQPIKNNPHHDTHGQSFDHHHPQQPHHINHIPHGDTHKPHEVFKGHSSEGHHNPSVHFEPSFELPDIPTDHLDNNLNSVSSHKPQLSNDHVIEISPHNDHFRDQDSQITSIEIFTPAHQPSRSKNKFPKQSFESSSDHDAPPNVGYGFNFHTTGQELVGSKSPQQESFRNSQIHKLNPNHSQFNAGKQSENINSLNVYEVFPEDNSHSGFNMQSHFGSGSSQGHFQNQRPSNTRQRPHNKPSFKNHFNPGPNGHHKVRQASTSFESSQKPFHNKGSHFSSSPFTIGSTNQSPFSITGEKSPSFHRESNKPPHLPRGNGNHSPFIRNSNSPNFQRDNKRPSFPPNSHLRTPVLRDNKERFSFQRDHQKRSPFERNSNKRPTFLREKSKPHFTRDTKQRPPFSRGSGGKPSTVTNNFPISSNTGDGGGNFQRFQLFTHGTPHHEPDQHSSNSNFDPNKEQVDFYAPNNSGYEGADLRSDSEDLTFFTQGEDEQGKNTDLLRNHRIPNPQSNSFPKANSRDHFQGGQESNLKSSDSPFEGRKEHRSHFSVSKNTATSEKNAMDDSAKNSHVQKLEPKSSFSIETGRRNTDSEVKQQSHLSRIVGDDQENQSSFQNKETELPEGKQFPDFNVDIEDRRPKTVEERQEASTKRRTKIRRRPHHLRTSNRGDRENRETTLSSIISKGTLKTSKMGEEFKEPKIQNFFTADEWSQKMN